LLYRGLGRLGGAILYLSHDGVDEHVHEHDFWGFEKGLDAMIGWAWRWHTYLTSLANAMKVLSYRILLL